MESHPTCIFCQIAAGRAPAKIEYQDERITAFRDTHPLAPVHILVIPNQHFDSILGLGAEQESLLGHLLTVAAQLAEQNGLDRNGFRLMVNTGPDAGQTVFHLHLHMLGGRRLPLRFEP